MTWIAFVKKYRADHPSMSWKAALKAASGPYKEQKGKEKKSGFKPPKLRKSKKAVDERRPNSCDCFHDKVKMSTKKKVKHECGICERQSKPKKAKVYRRTKRSTSSSSRPKTDGSAKRRKLDL